jgi:phytoene dehydrogenase-like protein
MNSEFDCIVVGAGLAGLVAAHFMQSAGLSTLIIEASDRPGGRVKSDLIDGFTLDHGFQVINPSYSNIKQLGVLDFLHFTPMVNGIVPFRPTDSGLNFVAAKRAFLRGVFLDEPKNVAPIVRREIYKSFISGKPGFVDGGASAFSQALANPISNIHNN